MIPVPVLSHRRIAALGGAAAAAVCLPVLVLLVIVAGPPPAPEAAATSVPGANVPRGGGSTRAVGGITVAAELAPKVEALLVAARSDGVTLGGSGYRTTEEQIRLRRAHCGSTDYAIYRQPSSECHPPTAVPGQSMHERGLAIDFTCGRRLVTRVDRCFVWLVDNASRYGLFNLPSEPWHWSTTGA
jgi:LAS superfamily LD-carboxypeptidase LdcB